MNAHALVDAADLVSQSAHKIYGPMGIGALYIRRDIKRLIEPIIHGGGQQHNLRPGALPTPLCVGFGAAVELLTGIDADQESERVLRLRDLFLTKLRGLSWLIVVNGSLLSRHPGNANVQFQGFSADDLLGTLQPRLAASTGSAYTSGIRKRSHVLRAIGLSNEQASASLRF